MQDPDVRRATYSMLPCPLPALETDVIFSQSIGWEKQDGTRDLHDSPKVVRKWYKSGRSWTTLPYVASGCT